MLEKTLVDLKGDWKLYREGKIHPKENGIYKTIRAGYSRIYEMVNEWRDGKWLAGVLDGSFTIYWETTKLSLDEVLRYS